MEYALKNGFVFILFVVNCISHKYLRVNTICYANVAQHTYDTGNAMLRLWNSVSVSVWAFVTHTHTQRGREDKKNHLKTFGGLWLVRRLSRCVEQERIRTRSYSFQWRTMPGAHVRNKIVAHYYPKPEKSASRIRIRNEFQSFHRIHRIVSRERCPRPTFHFPIKLISF